MSEQVSTAQQEYLQQHPDAVQDKELAHSMALAGDRHESRAVELRKQVAGEIGQAIADEAWGASLSAGDGRQPMNQKVEGVVNKIEQENRTADALYAKIAEAHDKIQATKR